MIDIYFLISLSGVIFSTSKEVFKNFEKYKEDFAKLKKKQFKLYDSLLKNRTIINSDTDEIDLIRFLNKKMLNLLS